MCINKFLLDLKLVGNHGTPFLVAMTIIAIKDLNGNDSGKDKNLTLSYFWHNHEYIFMTLKFGITCPKHNVLGNQGNKGFKLIYLTYSTNPP